MHTIPATSEPAGPECLSCDGEHSCLLPLTDMGVITCRKGDVCAAVNTSADLGPGEKTCFVFLTNLSFEKARLRHIIVILEHYMQSFVAIYIRVNSLKA